VTEEAAEMAEEGEPPVLTCEPMLRGRTLPTTSTAEDVDVVVETCAAELASASAAKAAAKAAAAAAA